MKKCLFSLLYLLFASLAFASNTQPGIKFSNQSHDDAVIVQSVLNDAGQNLFNDEPDICYYCTACNGVIFCGACVCGSVACNAVLRALEEWYCNAGCCTDPGDGGGGTGGGGGE